MPRTQCRYWVTTPWSRPSWWRTAVTVAGVASGPASTSAASPCASRGTQKTSTEATASTRAAEGSRLRAYRIMAAHSLRQVRVVEVEVVVHVVLQVLELGGDRERVRADDQVVDELLLQQEVVHPGVGGVGLAAGCRPELLGEGAVGAGVEVGGVLLGVERERALDQG